MTEYSSPEESSTPSMLTMGIVLLMIAGLGVAFYVTYKMWMDEDATFPMLFAGGAAVTKGPLSSKAASANTNNTNKYIAVGITALMTLFVMVFVYKTFM